MLRRARRFAEPWVAAADATQLPFASGRFDASLSGFLLNHLPEPFRLVAEAARVTRRGGMVMTMTFAAGDNHPVKATVDEVAARWGWEAPAWYHEQRHWAALTDTPAGLRAQAQQAGLDDADVFSVEVDAGLRTPTEFVTWRLGMAHMAGFVSEIPASERRRLVAEAELAVTPHTQPLLRLLLILSSRLPA
jgi:SAM-dependent methyltransferase